MPQLVKNATVREEILQGMITSFQLEGIKISQETAYTILERVDLAEFTVKLEAEFGIDIFETGLVENIRDVKDKLNLK